MKMYRCYNLSNLSNHSDFCHILIRKLINFMLNQHRFSYYKICYNASSCFSPVKIFITSLKNLNFQFHIIAFYQNNIFSSIGIFIQIHQIKQIISQQIKTVLSLKRLLFKKYPLPLKCYLFVI